MSWVPFIVSLVVFFSGMTITFIAVQRLLPVASEIGLCEARVGKDCQGPGPALLGGPVLFLCFVVSCLAWAVAYYAGILGTLPLENIIRIVFFGAATSLVFLIGLIDDIKELSWRKKILGQGTAILFLLVGGHYPKTATLPLLGVTQFGYWGIPILIIGIFCVVNAVNLLDGMDGWCGGACFFSSLIAGVVATQNGDFFVAVIGMAMAGSLVAFLHYNWPPARIYLGDSGSLMLGFVLGTFALSPMMTGVGERSSVAGILLVTMVPLGVAFFDTSLAVIRRLIRGHKITIRDQDHLYHWMRRYLGTRKKTLIFLYSYCGIVSFFVIIAELSPGRTIFWFAVIAATLFAVLGVLWVLLNYKLEALSVMLSNRPSFKLLGKGLSDLKTATKTSKCPLASLELVKSGVSLWQFDSVSIQNGASHIKQWANNNPKHSGNARFNLSTKLCDLPDLTITCAIPYHKYDSYNFYLRITWQIFLNCLSVEIKSNCESFESCLHCENRCQEYFSSIRSLESLELNHIVTQFNDDETTALKNI